MTGRADDWDDEEPLASHSEEELASWQRRRASTGGSRRKGGGTRGRAGNAVPSSGNALLLFAILVLAGVIAGVYWRGEQMQTRLQSQLAETREQLRLSGERIAALEGDVSETGVSLSAVGDEAEKRIKFLDTEIRKLWAVANKRNKARIEALEENQKSLQAQLKSAEADQQALEKKLKSQSGQFAGVKKSLTAMEARIAQAEKAAGERELALSTRIEQGAAQMNRIAASLRDLQAQAAGLSTLSSRAGVLQAALDEHGERLQSIDLFRRQTNEFITQFQASLARLQQQVDGMSRPY